ncbi:MAG: hypothetical protein GWP08_03765 [Nitrospiraceae bacterium]|nr:hypothetical protein [Nitrospiraceae bacterium]
MDGRPVSLFSSGGFWHVPCGGPGGPVDLEDFVRCDGRLPFEDLDGSGLLAVIDQQAGTGTLVRDKLGLRQLYYFEEAGRLWFSDDLRVLLLVQQPAVHRLQGLLEWMHYGMVLAPHTMFEGIFSVPPGAKLVYDWERGTTAIQKYFELQDTIRPKMAARLARARPAELLSELEGHLSAVIERIVRGREGVTVLVSGGVDSSILAGLALRHAPVDAVTVDVCGPGAESELHHARAVAKHLGLEQRVCSFGPREFRERLCDTVYAMALPLIVESAVAVSHAAIEGAIPPYQLLMDGEGADTLHCCDYQYSVLPKILSRLAPFSPERLRRGVERFRGMLTKVGLETSTVVDDTGLDVLFGGRKLPIQEQFHDLEDAFGHMKDSLERELCAMSLQSCFVKLQPMFARLDTMAALANTHYVAPFMWKEVFEFSINLPMPARVRFRWNRRGHEEKWLLKKLAASLVPPDVIYRPKGGFTIPGRLWLGPFPERWIQDSFLCEQFRIPASAFRSWLAQNAESRDRFFVVTLEMWGRLFARGDSFEQVRGEWLEASAEDSPPPTARRHGA